MNAQKGSQTVRRRRRNAIKRNSHQSHQDYTAQLPDEILDLIIRETGPRYGTALNARSLADKKNWVSCASVCRGWHPIALAYSFRYLIVSETLSSDLHSGLTSSNFYLFLQENPLIAMTVKEVHFLRITVNMQLLSSILDALPNLRGLMLSLAAIEGTLSTEGIPTVGRTIDTLVYCMGPCVTGAVSRAVCDKQVPLLLSLFSKIGEYVERDCRCLSGHELSSEPTEGITPQIRSFDSSIDSSALYRLGLLEHLTCLHLAIFGGDRDLDLFRTNFLQLITTTRLKLRELNLTVYLCIATPLDERGPQLPSVIAEAFRGGLAACPFLHGFRLNLEPRVLRQRSRADEADIHSMFRLGFLTGIEILALLDANQIEHVSFRYTPGDLNLGQHLLQVVRSLDLTRFRQVYQRFVNLRSFTLDTGSFLQGHFRACCRAQMRQTESKDVMLYGEVGTYFRCDDPTCAWYSGSAVGRHITLRRDVLTRVGGTRLRSTNQRQ
ncbi:hypothetical protein BDY19DRAFT_377956 [Irpex rosettiformis]|uniref:Uncharacterized protein n=1 Tax=Irpex rosettiformis TaxID=378272 RepID=A0ACB8TVK0_9APHY|nr:hypothetical protein BDY19DRAFT_377956 [Irpex rosettiformis]